MQNIPSTSTGNNNSTDSCSVIQDNSNYDVDEIDQIMDDSDSDLEILDDMCYSDDEDPEEDYLVDKMIDENSWSNLCSSGSWFFKRIFERFSKEDTMFLRQAFTLIATTRVEKCNMSFADSQYYGHKLIKFASMGMAACNKFMSHHVKFHLTKFVNSEKLQLKFLRAMNEKINPKPLIVNGQEIGQYFSIIELSKMVLQNQDLVQSILKEKSNDNQLPGCPIENELNTDKHDEEDGKLRINFGSDDFSTPKGYNNKFLSLYSSFTNIPYCQRLKRRSFYLTVIADRSRMKKANATCHDVLQTLAKEMIELSEKGVNIVNHSNETINIKGVLTTFISDNLGAAEVLGRKCHFYKGFECRVCGSNFKDIQSWSHPFNQIGSSQDKEVFNLLRTSPGGLVAPNNYGIERWSPLFDIPGINPWNSFPLDPMHDIHEGVLIRFIDIILRDSVLSETISHNQICEKLNKTKLFHGNSFQIGKKKRKRDQKTVFTVHGKAVEVCTYNVFKN